ncbi:MAG: DUF3078 domain-containing protein [Muribaculaceae bacterium]|nr:DUF3078 domain-containing protein [Muribaculaceae bacterium]
MALHHRFFLLSLPLFLTTFASSGAISPNTGSADTANEDPEECVCRLCRDCVCHEPHYSAEDLYELRLAIPDDPMISEYYSRFPVRVFEPRIFSGFRTLQPHKFQIPPLPFTMDARAGAYDRDRYAGILYATDPYAEELEEGDEVLTYADLVANDSISRPVSVLPDSTAVGLAEPLRFEIIPEWLAIGLNAERIHQDMTYRLMVEHPALINYAYWDLPVPPRLPEDDHSFRAFLESLDLPQVDTSAAYIPKFERHRINWLHSVGGAFQLSQAYISSNWYQGGNNYIAFLFNFNWNVTLNTVYHPNLLFISDLNYKLAVNSNPKGSLHDYSISQDLFQYNLRTGVKAFRKWFYSLNALFKTQFFTNYPDDSMTPNAKILSPMEFNLGLGMTYSTTGRKGNLKFDASISPLSYNLKACPSMKIDHSLFNIGTDRRTASEFGSSAELTLNWQISSNISWKSRLFLFTDYHYFQGDWENTFNFAINRFLSTQLYLHPRFDSSTDRNATDWHYWQLKEILSFGLSYTFTTAP